MKSVLKLWLLAACALAFAAPVAAQQTRAYAPEDLRGLSYNDQVRVISLEYSDQSGGRRIPDDQLRFYLDQINRSNWRFSQIKDDIARSLGGGMGPGPGPGTGQTVRCESQDGRQHSCAAPWHGRSRLVRKLSRGPCDEGETWYSEPGRIHVRNGCRGEFAEDRMGPGGNRVVCESHNSRHNRCRTPWMAPSRLERQLSSKQCIEGRNWGSERGEIWVDHGCRGEFGPGLGQGGGWGGGWDNNYSVTCVSNNVMPTTCAWDNRHGRPYLLEQLSRARCTENVTWGYHHQRGLWVSGGCRARFGTR